jgi:alpha-tubulin suppressor-like RCC1 family protein
MLKFKFSVAALLVVSTVIGSLPASVAEAAASDQPVKVATGYESYMVPYGNGYYSSSAVYTAGLKGDGTVWVWGNNAYGVTGDGTTDNVTYPKQVEGVSEIKDIKAGGGFVLAQDTSEQVWMWGTMSDYSTTLPKRSEPHVITLSGGTPLQNVVQIAASENAAYALTSSGQLYSWGYGGFNELGQGSSVTESVYASPVLQADGTAITSVTSIAAGRNTAYAISGGNLYAWGADYTGQLGCSGCSFTGFPVQVSLPVEVSPQQVYASSNASYAFAWTSGGLYAWGANSYSQLGKMTSSSVNLPEKITSVSGNVVSAALGTNHSLLLLDDHSVWGAGSNRDLQLLSNGDRFDNIATFQNVGLSDASFIAAGIGQSYAILSAGDDMAWGANSATTTGPYDYMYNILGTGDDRNEDVSPPVPMMEMRAYSIAPVSVQQIALMEYNKLTVSFAYPQVSMFDEIHADIYTLGGGKLVQSNQVGKGADTIYTDTLVPDTYEVHVYTRDSTTNTTSNVVIDNNGGSGYVISPGNVHFTLRLLNKATQAPLTSWQVELGHIESPPIATGTTDATGTVVLDNLYPGQYDVMLTPSEADSDSYTVPWAQYNLQGDNEVRTLNIVPSGDPSELQLDDTDAAKGSIQGTLDWYSPDNGEGDFTEYRFYLEDASHHKMNADGSLTAVQPVAVQSVLGYYDYSVPLDTAVPAQAESVALYVYSDGSGEKRTSAFANIWDGPVALPQHVYMEDTNPAAGVSNMIIHWAGLADESHIQYYDVISDGDVIARIPKTGASDYQASVPGATAYTPEAYVEPYEIGIENTDGSPYANTVQAFPVDNIAGQGSAVVLEQDSYTTVPSNVRFAATDSSPGYTGGTVLWTGSTPDDGHNHNAFDLYFVDGANHIVGSIGRLYDNNGYTGDLTYRIPDHTVLPTGATGIAVYGRYYDLVSQTAGIVALQSAMSSKLSALSVDNGTLNPNFSPDTMQYSVYVDSSTAYVNISASAQDSTATVQMATYTPVAGSVTRSVYVNDELTPIPITVTSTSGDKTQYTVNIYRNGGSGANGMGFYTVQYFGVPDATVGSTSGSVTWSAYGAIPSGSMFRIGYYDANDHPIGSPIAETAISANSYTIPNSTMPSGATRIGVAIVNSGAVLAVQTAPVWFQSYYPQNFRLLDTNTAAGAINAVLTWDGAADESQLSGYRVYYMTKDLTAAVAISDIIPKNTIKSYRYALAAVPAGTVALLVDGINLRNELSPIYQTQWLYDDMTSSPVPEVQGNSLNPAANTLLYNDSTVPGKLVGSVEWSVPSSNRSSVLGYRLYFTDVNGVKLRPIGTVYYGNADYGFYSLQSVPIAAGAVGISVYTIGLDRSESAGFAKVGLTTTALKDLSSDGTIDMSIVQKALSTKLDVNGDGQFDRGDVMIILNSLPSRYIH